MFRPYGVIIRPSLWTILLKSCVHPWDPKQCLQMLTSYRFVSNRYWTRKYTKLAIVKKLRTFLGSQTSLQMWTSYSFVSNSYWTRNYTKLIIVNIVWDPKNVRSFLKKKWFIVKAW